MEESWEMMKKRNKKEMFYNLCIFTGQYHSQSMICNKFQDKRSRIVARKDDHKMFLNLQSRWINEISSQNLTHPS